MKLAQNTSIPSFNAEDTAQLLSYSALVTALADACAEYNNGQITCPERLNVPLQNGGVMLSMPASARDIAIHKLVTVCPNNPLHGLPTLHGHVIACNTTTGESLFMLDGPTLTGRRTAAISMLGIKTLHRKTPKEILIIGTGKQAAHHIEAIAELFPHARVLVKGSSRHAAENFCDHFNSRIPALTPLINHHIPPTVDIVITLTTSKTPVYAEPAMPGRLIIGVGSFTPNAAEIDAQTVSGSEIFVDDPFGAKHEAGDLIQAGVDWSRVRSLAEAIRAGVSLEKPLLFKSVGCAAWDLAACRVVRNRLEQSAPLVIPA